MYVDMVDSPSGKSTLKPSFAAAPGLSVTPGLNPTVTVRDGGIGKKFWSSSKDVLVAPNSMIGSEKISWTCGSISEAE